MPSALNSNPTAATVLIIDDDAQHAASVRDLLDAQGYAISTTTDGREGLRRILDRRVDVLILDLNMPQTSGLDVLDALHSMPASEMDRPKTIVLSGESDISQVAPVLRLGAYDYLTKPYDPAQLLKAVRNAVERCQLERERALLVAAREADHERHAFLVNAAPDLIYLLDADGRLQFHNNHLADVFGTTARSAVGQHWREVVPKDLHTALEHRVNERRTSGRATRHLEVELHGARGDARTLELSSTGIYDATRPAADSFRGTYGVVRDITAARRANQALAQSQEKFRALFYSSPDAVFISHLEDGSIIECNENFVRIMDGTSNRPIDNDALVWGDRSARLAFARRLQQSPDRYSEVFTTHRNGSTRTHEVTARLLTLDGDTCIVASVRDLTAQKQAEEDRLNLQTKLQQASKMEAIGQLAGGIAHDFNNILASIIGYTELAMVAAPRTDPAQVKSYLGEVVTAGQRARDLISQMLTFTRAHRGNAVATDIAVTIGEVSRMLRAAIPKSIDIRNEFADVPMVRVDPIQLQQVLINLLVNASDSITGNGRIDVRVRTAVAAGHCVACNSPLQGSYVELAVSDTGHGIERDLLPRVFDMFVSTRDPGRGTGMGLWLVNTIVHEYGGHLLVDTSSKGTTFHVYLPSGERAALVRAELEPVADAPPIKGHVLVIDDEVSVGNFIGEVLRNAGYEAVVYNDAAAAIDHLTRRASEISLVLTDFAMPQFTGLDVAEAAGALDTRIPVVIVTGFADRTDKARMARLGVSRLLTKPFRIEALLGVVRELVLSSDRADVSTP